MPKPRMLRMGELPTHTEDEALELCWHHLELAFLFFSSAPDGAAARAEFERLVFAHYDHPDPKLRPIHLPALLGAFSAFKELFDGLK